MISKKNPLTTTSEDPTDPEPVQDPLRIGIPKQRPEIGRGKDDTPHPQPPQTGPENNECFICCFCCFLVYPCILSCLE